MTYEITAVVFGSVSIFTVEAPSAQEARRLARDELRRVSPSARIEQVRPQGAAA